MVPSIREYDVRRELTMVVAPTLVLHREAERIPLAFGRDLGERVLGARTEVLPGDEHICFFDGEDILDRILRFLDAPATARRRDDRALLTLVYTDIVGSTTTAAELGDERWRSVLAQHDRITAEETAAHGGRVVKSLGDGALLAFERPAAAVECAIAVRERVAEHGLALRAAVHTGECELVGDDIAGLTAHVAARLLGEATGDEIVVSGTVRDLTLGSGLSLVPKTSVELRDLPGRWDVLVAAGTGSDPAAVPAGDRITTGGDAMTVFDRSVVAMARRTPRLSRAVIGTLTGRRAART